MLLADLLATKPDFVNAEGVEWWLDKDTTAYAASRGLSSEYKAWIVREKSGHVTRLLTDASGVLFENQNLEAFGVRIDMMAFDKENTQ